MVMFRVFISEYLLFLLESNIFFKTALEKCRGKGVYRISTYLFFQSVTSTKVEMRFGLNPWRKASEETKISQESKTVESLSAPSLIKSLAAKSSQDLG